VPVLTLPASDVPPEAWRAKALVFEDPVSRGLLERIQQIAPSEATVLVTGETGTGKEIVARHIHDLSARRGKPFVAVNCGAFAETLIESDLFGHERGAFTGAATTRAGWFEAAHGGTLFLDEIGELPLGLQVKLLRVLQEREVVRLGARQSIPVDVRLIAATNARLPDEVAAGRFRSDLFYRLDVAALELAPLRDRPGDILPLAGYFLELYAHRLGAGRTVLSAAAADRLLAHRWPGNIRELENVIHRALVVCRDQTVGADDIRLAAVTAVPEPAASRGAGTDVLEAALLALFEQNLPDLYARIEETVLRAAYRYSDRNQLQTARLLGISRNVVRARLIQFGELAGAPRVAPAIRSEPRASVTVRIGFQKFGLLTLLKARGTLEAALRPLGHNVEWIEFPGGTQLVEALQRGAIDVGKVGEVPPILAQAARAPIVYLAAEPPAPGGEAIVVHPDSPIHRVADLKGKTVALNQGANVDYLLIRALEEARVPYDDVKVAFVPPTGGRAAFESREVDAWAIWNPLLASVAHATGARVLRDATGLATNTAYYVASRGFADAQPALIEIFLAEVRALGAWANDNTEAVIDLLAPTLGISRPALADALAQVRFGARPIDAAVVAGQQEVADTFFRLRRIPRAVRISDARWTPPVAI
jgi:aliphatic sulfonates family ABC transporter substrate-binding protein